MLLNIADKLRHEFSEERAFAHVAEICQHHRIQASPGFRDAARYCYESFVNAGLQANLLSYAGDSKTKYWGQVMPGEWACRKAELHIITPNKERLACYADVPLSLIQRSCATPEGGIEAELVVLDKGDDEEAYQDVDFNGKIVLTSEDINKVRNWAIEKRGAIGIVADRITEVPPIRYRYDLGDALQYTSFWWRGNEKKCFGFVVSPRVGDKLRAMAAKEKISLFAEIDAEFCDGKIEVVEAVIPGTSDEEVVVMAHLCHPYPSANDNASGSGVVLELARALNSAIEKGELPRPKRSIRFLLIPEMSGSYAYLANNSDNIPKMVAAINLDMVGENQALCKSTLKAVRPPHASMTFAGDLIKAVTEAVIPQYTDSTEHILFNYAVTPFSGGSDHYIFTDPTVGVGCPMLLQWPDKFYHTSADTIDKVDPAMLRRVGIITGTYSYFAANAYDQDAWWLGQKIVACFSEEVTNFIARQNGRMVQNIDGQEAEKIDDIATFTSKHIKYLSWLKRNELTSLKKLTSADFDAMLTLLYCRIDNLTSTYLTHWEENIRAVETLYHIMVHPEVQRPNEWKAKAAAIIPKRIYRGPFSLAGRIEQLPEQKQLEHRRLTTEHSKAANSLPVYLQYWMDGSRTLSQIGEHLEHEVSFVDWEFLVRYVELLQELNLVTVTTVK